MNSLLDSLMICVLLTSLMLLASSRLVSCIRLVAVQGVALSLLPVIAPDGNSGQHWLLALGTIIVKGIILPWLLLRARQEADVPREVEPYVGFGASLLIGVVLLAGSFWLSSRLVLPGLIVSHLLVPVAFLALFTGIFMMVARRKALTQVLGYLVMENGIYVFGVTFARHQPLLVEMGILLDLLAGVFVMGITIFHINREFDHIDIDRLSLLTDVSHRSRGSAMTAALILLPVIAGILAFLLPSPQSRRLLLMLSSLGHACLVAASWFSPIDNIGPGWIMLDVSGRLFLSVTTVLFLAASSYTTGFLRRENSKEGARVRPFVHRLPAVFPFRNDARDCEPASRHAVGRHRSHNAHQCPSHLFP